METTGCYLKQMHLPCSHPKKHTYCSLSSHGTQSISWVQHWFCISVNIHQHIIEPKQSPHTSKILLTACLPLLADFPFHLQRGSQTSFPSESLLQPLHTQSAVLQERRWRSSL